MNKSSAHALKMSRVDAAREELRSRALEFVEMYIANIRAASVKGDYKTVAESLQWLIKHSPASEEGLRIIDPPADAEIKGLPAPPSIQIGIAVGGVGDRKGRKLLRDSPRDSPRLLKSLEEGAEKSQPIDLNPIEEDD